MQKTSEYTRVNERLDYTPCNRLLTKTSLLTNILTMHSLVWFGVYVTCYTRAIYSLQYPVKISTPQLISIVLRLCRYRITLIGHVVNGAVLRVWPEFILLATNIGPKLW